jgi:hypothetical protein
MGLLPTSSLLVPGQLLRYESFCFSSVGIRNHWLGVIPRGPFDPISHYNLRYTFRDIHKPWEYNENEYSVTVRLSDCRPQT